MPSQAFAGAKEGVESRRRAPTAYTARVKACSRPRTRADDPARGRRKPKWYENPPPLKACRFDSDLGHHNPLRRPPQPSGCSTDSSAIPASDVRWSQPQSVDSQASGRVRGIGHRTGPVRTRSRTRQRRLRSSGSASSASSPRRSRKHAGPSTVSSTPTSAARPSSR